MSNYRFTIIGTDGTKAMFRSIKAGLGGVRRGVNSTQLKFAALAGVTGLGAVVNSSRQTIDVLAKTSKELGVQTEKLAALQHAAKLTGSTNDGLSKGLKKLQKSIADANNGLSTYTRAFDKLQIDPAALQRMTPDEQFRAVGVAMAGVATQTERVAIAYDIFGGRNTALLNTLVEVGENFGQIEQDVKDYGLALSRVDAAQVEEANDQLTRVGAIAQGLGQKLTVHLAPFIGVIAERLIGVAKEGVDMERLVTSSFNSVAKAVGVFADGVHGIKIVFKGVELVVTGFGSVVISTLELGTRAIFQFAAEVNGVINKLIEGMNKLPKVDIPLLQTDIDEVGAVQFVTALGEAMREKTVELRSELHDLMMADLPSAVVEQKWAEITADVERRAREVAAKVRAQMDAANEIAPIAVTAERREADPKIAAKVEAERARIAERLQRLDESHFTELEMIQSRYDKEIEVLRLAREKQLITEEEFQQKKLRSEETAAQATSQLEQATWASRLGMAQAGLNTMMAFSNGGSKKMFKAQKALALAQAAVALPPAIIESFKNAGGYPWGLIPAAAMAVQGAAQIASIKRQQFGGGASIASVGGGGGEGGAPTPRAQSTLSSGIGSQFNQQTRQSPQNVLNLTINGDVNGDTAETVISRIRDLVEDQDVVLFSAGSRQGQELVPA